MDRAVSPPPLDDSAFTTTPVDDYYVEDQEDRGETDRLLAEWQQYLTPSQRLIVQGQASGQAQGQSQGIGHGEGQRDGQGDAASPTSSYPTRGASSNPKNGNHGNDLQNSIEIDDGHHDGSQEEDQNAQPQILPQGRDSESTAVTDQDMQMIGMDEDGDEMKVFDDDDHFGWSKMVGAKGLSVDDAIVLD